MYLGIDLGTSGLKLLLLDAQHQVHATADAPLTQQHPQALWSEQSPADWWTGLELAVAQLRAQAPLAWGQVRAIGLSGQMHGAVLLDAQGAVLRPAILWNDGRSGAQCAELEAAEPRARNITGNLAMPGFTAPKLLWLRTHEPHIFERIDKVLLPKDWLRLQLSGDAVSEMSDASGTLWLDVGQRCWSDSMLHACGLTLAQMPRLVEGSQTSAGLRAELARAWGLRAGIPIAGGGGDNAASAIGIGAARPGEGFVSLGTSGVSFLVGERFQPDPARAVHAFAHALPGRWHQMAVMLSAASAFGWATRLTGQPDEAALAQQVALLTPAQREQAPLFLPYLSGERTPHNDPHASGTLIGLRDHHGAGDIGYAVMEGVGFALADGLDAMCNGQPVDTPLSLVGGGAVNADWAQLLATLLQRPLLRPAGAGAAAALGAARLAWLADGGVEREVCIALPTERAFAPATPSAGQVARRARFNALYPALRGLF